MTSTASSLGSEHERGEPQEAVEVDPLDARILVVDDEPANVLLLERILGKAGYRSVRSTTDPEAVLRTVTEFRPDVLLLDLKMPRLDGFAILELLRTAEAPDPDLPILVLTADATGDTKRRALEAGARDFLTKPFDMEEVLLRIADMLALRPARNA